MRRIHTPRTVARMKAKRHRVETVGQEKGDSMRLDTLAFDSEPSIAAHHIARRPEPALALCGVVWMDRTVFVHLGPKPFLVLGREFCEWNCSVWHICSVLIVRVISPLERCYDPPTLPRPANHSKENFGVDNTRGFTTMGTMSTTTNTPLGKAVQAVQARIDELENQRVSPVLMTCPVCGAVWEEVSGMIMLPRGCSIKHFIKATQPDAQIPLGFWERVGNWFAS